MKSFSLAIFVMLVSSCGKYISTDAMYKARFTKGNCARNEVYFTPRIQTIGIPYEDIDTVKVIWYKGDGLFQDPIDSIEMHINAEDLDVLSADEEYQKRDDVTLEKLATYYNKSFIVSRLLDCSIDILIKTGSKSYKISEIMAGNMLVNTNSIIHPKDTLHTCCIYSYKINGVRRYSSNFLLVKTGFRRWSKGVLFILRGKIYVNSREYNDSAHEWYNFFYY